MRFLECAKFYVKLFKHVSGKVILTQLLVLLDWPLKKLAQARNNLMNDSLCNLYILLHIQILLLKLV